MDFCFFKKRIIVPFNLRKRFLQTLHEGHLGITKTKAMARTCIYWPNISSEIEKLVQRCNAKLALIPQEIPKSTISCLGRLLFEMIRG